MMAWPTASATTGGHRPDHRYADGQARYGDAVKRAPVLPSVPV
jgi:hypothetical protein